ncbi:MAG: hypothetical protein ACTSP9_14980 [Promethearchaeota archaeon]
MTYAIQFNEKQLQCLEFDYAKIRINHEQLKVIQLISNDLRVLMSISPLAMKSIVSSAFSEWQTNNNLLISDLQNKPINEKIMAFKEIFNLGKKALKCIVEDPVEKNELLLDIVFEKGFKMLIEHLNRSHRR